MPVEYIAVQASGRILFKEDDGRGVLYDQGTRVELADYEMALARGYWQAPGDVPGAPSEEEALELLAQAQVLEPVGHVTTDGGAPV